jgi:branched-subunit amino acid transport protein
MKNYLLLIVGMMAVTYIPRLIPLIALSDKPLPPVVRRYLQYIPYTALGALIVRGVTETSTNTLLMVATIGGILMAALCSWFKKGLVISVLASILTAFVILTYM